MNLEELKELVKPLPYLHLKIWKLTNGFQKRISMNEIEEAMNEYKLEVNTFV